MIESLNSIASAVSSAAVNAVSGAAGGAAPVGAPGAPGAGATPFADLLTDAVGQMSKLEQDAQSAVEGLMTGSGVDVHRAMIATQKAGMAFELALAVRNKAVAAYQQVIGMQF